MKQTLAGVGFALAFILFWTQGWFLLSGITMVVALTFAGYRQHP